jgi:hypothetical protein
MRIVYRFVCFLLFLPLPVLAQTGIYASFSASNFDVPNVNWQYGPMIGIYHDFWHPPFLGIGADIRGSFIGSGSTKLYGGVLGPRVDLHPPVFPVKPYVEVLGGIGQANFGEGFATTNTTSFEYQLVAGVDVTIFPRIDWRLAEFTYSGFSDLNENAYPKTISTGIVIRLP